jgi:mRNA interferase YafQ
MRYQVRLARQYQKDIKRLQRSGRYNLYKLDAVINLLAKGQELPPHHRRHRLQGDMSMYEECRVEGDWLLIFQQTKDTFVLVLVRTGTHSQLFG